MKARVLVLYTGGTIGMTPVDPAYPEGTRRPGTKEDLLRYLPPVRDGIEWELLSEPALRPMDSSDVGPREWLAMAAAIARNYDGWDGFVILHGTDTMAYTASALSFLFENLGKPVVLTGSQTPLFHERTDGRLNFLNALRIAGYKAVRLPAVPEVTICFGNVLLRGNRARKMSTSDTDAFESPNLRPLAAIESEIFVDRSLARPRPSDPFRAAAAMCEEVVDITIVPGLRAELLRALICAPPIRGAILRTFGQGNPPNSPALLRVLGDAVAAGKVIVNVTQCARGFVNMYQYENGRALVDLGVTSGLDLTPEAALTKLAWLLGAKLPPAEVRRRMQIGQRGEQTFDLMRVPAGDEAGFAADRVRHAFPMDGDVLLLVEPG
ncbi:MAG: asparaginase [Acidobacteria bacterium]|nr:asparaginase [Acidobacteriota bacterium]